MVSYYNPLTMYRHQQQSGQYSPGSAGCYPQPTQQYLPACMGNVESHSVGSHWPGPETHKYFACHHPAFSSEWHQDYNHFQVLMDGNSVQQPSPPISEVSSSGGGGLTPPSGMMVTPRSNQARCPYEWMKKTFRQSQPNRGKTRTKDKYRVVYTDYQRLELEKEFHYTRYINARRKVELANNLGLSERQIKIWFQNRRAKDRKEVKRRGETQQNAIKQEVGVDPISAVAVTSVPDLGIHSPLNPMQHPGGNVPHHHGGPCLM